MNLPDLSAVSAFDVARLAAAAAFGWGLVSALWKAVSGAMTASVLRYCGELLEMQKGELAELRRSLRRNDEDDNTPPGPPAAA